MSVAVARVPLQRVTYTVANQNALDHQKQTQPRTTMECFALFRTGTPYLSSIALSVQLFKKEYEMDDLQEYHMGREVATNEVDEPNFEVDQAIASFDFDPPDSNFQRGYLRGLLKSGYATVLSKWDGV